MSTNSIVVGNTRSGLTISANFFRRGSGTGTIPVLGSLVQKGKFSAAIPALVKALNRVDLPTCGRPTMPQLKPITCSQYINKIRQYQPWYSVSIKLGKIGTQNWAYCSKFQPKWVRLLCLLF